MKLRYLYFFFFLLTYFGKADNNKYQPESCVYYPRMKDYLIANLGKYDKGPTLVDPGFIATPLIERITLINYKRRIENPKGLLMEGDTLYLLEFNQLLSFDMVKQERIDSIDVVPQEGSLNNPPTTDMVKIGNDFFVTDKNKNTIHKVNLKDTTVTDLGFGDNIKMPRGIIYDEQNNRLVFVTQEEHSKIYAIDLGNYELSLLKETDIPNMYGITTDTSGNYYISAWEENNNRTGRVYKYAGSFDTDPEIILDSLKRPGGLYYNALFDEVVIPDLGNYGTHDYRIMYYSKAPVPPAPLLIAPANNEENQSTGPELQWQKVEGAIYYKWLLSDDMTFPAGNFYQYIVNNNVAHLNGLKESTTYYWMVKSINHNGESEWSEMRQFTTAASTIAPPVLISTYDVNNPAPVTPMFVWHPVDADRYNLQIYRDIYSFGGKGDNPSSLPDFIDPIYDIDRKSDTSYILKTPLEGNTLYYWRVRGIKDNIKGQWSAVQSFITEGTSDVEYNPQESDLINISPNPVTEDGIIRISTEPGKYTKLVLINYNGSQSKILYEGKPEGNEIRISLSGKSLNTGLYFIELLIDNKTYIKKLSVIK